MKKRKIYVTENDKNKLQKLFASTIGFRSRDLKTVKDLLNELQRAEVIDDNKIKNNVVTMNSTVQVKDLNTNEEFTYTIVYPEFADINENKISILAPIGTALLGYKAGDTIEWEVPRGKRKIKIMKVVYQPESTEKIAVW